MKKSFALSLLMLVFSFLGTKSLHAQDPQYSQAYANQLMLNPAFAGAAEGPRIAMNYRAQWVKIPGFYQQGAFSFDQPFFVGDVTQGYGIHFAYDRAGEGNLTKIDVFGNYAFQVDISDEHTIRFGLSGGFQQATLNFFKLRFPDQIDPRDGVIFPTDEPGGAGGFDGTQFRPDFNAGFAYFNEYAWLGLTVSHLTEPLQRFYTGPNSERLPADINARLPRKYTVTGGIRLPVGPFNDPDKIVVTPTFLYKQQGEFNQFDLGLYIDIEPMVFGVWYRNQDAAIGLVGVKQGSFSFAYSYDYTISELSQSVSGGSHEFSIVMEFEQDRHRRFKHKALPCPKF